MSCRESFEIPAYQQKLEGQVEAGVGMKRVMLTKLFWPALHLKPRY